MISVLRPHQVRALELLKHSLRTGHKRPMLMAPTGFGKTKLAAAIVDGALKKGKRVTFCVPAVSLIDQTVSSFWSEGIRDVGVIQGDHEMTNWARPVQVVSVQTLAKRFKQRGSMPDADIVVVDEAHEMFEFLKEWMRLPGWCDIPFVGLSATPWTKGLGAHYDDLLVAATTRELIAAGYLTPFKVYAPSHPDLSEVRTVGDDYNEADLAKVFNKNHLVADVVESWMQLGEGRSTLCFGVDRAHAKMLEQQFASRGVRTAYIDAYTTREERKEIGDRFHDGDVKVVCNIGTLTTGVDWDVRCIILARSTKSEKLFTQIVGRGLRTAEGKEDLIILDHGDSHLNLGFVTDIHHTTLDTGKTSKKGIAKSKESLPKECVRCNFLRPAGVHACPSCGFAPVPRSTVTIDDGSLVEFNDAAQKADKATKQRWMSMFRGYAFERGKTEKWVLAQYKQKFGVWPRGLDESVLIPDAEVSGWIKHRQIAWAKRNGGANARAA
ncbi:DEAD/DEAH box helicase [Labrys sp. KB_33_2]|uniref:DEAD/DEAH box helicase n=1 Tax=Labrys sp. KB_33_2 TaxID=3237479 RepID=UPI003F8F3936